MNQFQGAPFCLLKFHFNVVPLSTPRFSRRSHSVRRSRRISLLLRARHTSRSSLLWFSHADVTGSPLVTLCSTQILVTTQSTSVVPRRINVFVFLQAAGGIYVGQTGRSFNELLPKQMLLPSLFPYSWRFSQERNSNLKLWLSVFGS